VSRVTTADYLASPGGVFDRLSIGAPASEYYEYSRQAPQDPWWKDAAQLGHCCPIHGWSCDSWKRTGHCWAYCACHRLETSGR